MRLWSLHPALLDRAALIAGWRESLLAQNVLAGGTTGYTNHPQLRRFRAHGEPMAAIGAYLLEFHREATERGYRFDLTRVQQPRAVEDTKPIPVTTGQLQYELAHLRRKVAARAPDWLPRVPTDGIVPAAHPLLRAVPGDVEAWELR